MNELPKDGAADVGRNVRVAAQLQKSPAAQRYRANVRVDNPGAPNPKPLDP